VVGGDLGQEFLVTDACGSVQAGLDFDPCADRQCYVARQRDVLQVIRNVEVGLVERQRLNDRCVLDEDLAYLLADLPVDLEARLDEDEIRTLQPGGNRRQRRAQRTGVIDVQRFRPVCCQNSNFGDSQPWISSFSSSV
jgi:hypothetical protein